MRGWVEKRYETSWTIVIDLGKDKVTGERKRITESYKVDTKDEADGILVDRMYEIKHKKYIKRDNSTFGEYLDKWLKFRQSKLAPKTYASYHNEIERHIKPVLGTVPLQDLEAMHLQEYYYKMETEGRIKPKEGKGTKKKKDVSPGLSQRTINYHHRIMSAALKQAVKWKKIPYNPAQHVDIPTFEKKEMAFLRRDELDKFLTKIREHMDYAVIYTAVMTGMRQGEVLGLRWQDVDLDYGMINVRQQLQYLPGEGYFYKTPKSKKSVRSIPMQLPLNKMFREIKKAQEEYRQKELEKLQDKSLGEITPEDLKAVYNDWDLVLCQLNGKPWDAGNITNRFKELVIDFGRPELRFHDLRHTFAALAIAAGISMEKLQRLMGHESITTTIDMYGHIPVDTLSEEMKKLSQYLGFDALTK